MRIPYRQGLLGYPPNFLQVGSNGFINLVINDIPVTATVASGDKNYLITESRTVINAWGPFSGPGTQYLYWEINKFNGSVTRGATNLVPMMGANPPPQLAGQMWWDTNESKMKRWTGTRWEHVLRVFAGTFESSSLITPQPLQSQVALTSASTAGYILTDGMGGVFRSVNGDLLTSDTPITSIDTGSLVKFEGSQLIAIANESIPAFSLVYFVGPYRVGLASGAAPYNVSKAPIGLITDAAMQNDTVTLITAGKVVTNEEWEWPDAYLGKSVFCGPNGEFVTGKSGGYKNVRVGVITSRKSVLLTFDWETDVVNQEELNGGAVTTIHVNAPIIKTGVPSAPMLSMPRANSYTDGYLHQDDFNRIGNVEYALQNKADSAHSHTIGDVTGLTSALNSKTPYGHIHTQTEITGLSLTLANKSDVNHTHSIADVANLQPQLDSLQADVLARMPVVPTATDGRLAVFSSGVLVDSGIIGSNVALIGHTHSISNITDLQVQLDSKAALNHSHDISSVNNLQAELDLKANSYHVHQVNDVDGLQATLDNKSDVGHGHHIVDVMNLQVALDSKASLVHTHTITNVTGLQTALDGKANVSHAHSISNVSGLQTALDGKAATVHTHTIASVTGLQVALDSKANASHAHAIGDVTGLQTALDGKADTTHSHAISDVTGLELALNAKIGFSNTTPYTPIDDYNPASKLYVDSRSLNDISDVIAPTPQSDQYLKWTGAAWVPAFLPAQPPQTFQIVSVPQLEEGSVGDTAGMVAFSATHFYMCTANYDGITSIWKRMAWEPGGWAIAPSSEDFGALTDGPQVFEDYGSVSNSPSSSDDFGTVLS